MIESKCCCHLGGLFSHYAHGFKPVYEMVLQKVIDGIAISKTQSPATGNSPTLPERELP